MKTGILLEISYKGKYFDCFDEMTNKISTKGVLKKYLLDKGIKIIKGLQQAGRTDAKVSANSNYIYFMAQDFNLDIIELNQNINGLKILSVKKVKTNIILPDIVKKRQYIYYYPKKYIKADNESILKRCLEINGIKDFSRFTNHKGLKLKNMIRNVNVNFIDGKLIFLGDSFLPQQVRRMSGYILTGEIKPMNPKFLILDKIIF